MRKKILLCCTSLLMVVGLSAQDLVYIFGGTADSLNGQFAGGLNDWTVEAVDAGAEWMWTEDGSGSAGAFWGVSEPISSKSPENGAAIFNSDFLDNGGSGNQGTGSSPSPHTGHLISPSFSCENHETVVLTFHQYFRNFDAETYVGISIDGGTTWQQDTLNDNLVINFSSRTQRFGEQDELIMIDYSDIAAGQSDVRIRFTFEGEYYFWIIDDVEVVEKPEYSVSLGEYFMGINALTPASQITTDSTSFIVNVVNTGAMALTDLVVRVNILNSADEIIYTDSSTVLNFAPNSSENIILPGLWAPGDLPLDQYRFELEAIPSAEQVDPFPGDNFTRQFFLINEATYGKTFYFFEDNSPYFMGAYFSQNAGGEWFDYTIGNQFFTSDVWPNLAGVRAESATFAVTINNSELPIAGKSVTINLFELTDALDQDFGNFAIQDPPNSDNEQFKFVGIASYTFTADDEANITASSKFSAGITVDLNDFETFDPGVELKPGTRYLLAATYVENNNRIRHLLSNPTFGRTSGANYYAWSMMLYDYEAGQWFSGFINLDVSPVLKMNLGLTTSEDKIKLPEHTVSVFPNPTAQDINVDLAFENPSQGITILADVSGKVIEIKEFKNSTNERIQFNTNNLASGTYLVRVATDEGTKTTKVVVQK